MQISLSVGGFHGNGSLRAIDGLAHLCLVIAIVRQQIAHEHHAVPIGIAAQDLQPPQRPARCRLEAGKQTVAGQEKVPTQRPREAGWPQVPGLHQRHGYKAPAFIGVQGQARK